MTSFVILLAMIAFSPTQGMAKGPTGGGGGGNKDGGGGGAHPSGARVETGQKGGDHHVGAGGNVGVNQGIRSNPGAFQGQGTKQNQVFDARHRPDFSGNNGEGRDTWRYRWDNDRWWFYGPDNRWMLYGDDGRWDYYGREYVVRRPILEEYSGGPIKIVNPAKNKATLSYTLDGNEFTIPPGYSQEIQEDRAWVIEFSRGDDLEDARYGLQTGVYTFARTKNGWELYRSDVQQSAAPQPPKATLQPPKDAPTAPAPQ
jgi:hypothetical protein